MLILVVILVLGTGASQMVYRTSIEAMHQSLEASIETAELVHAAENFHSAIHSMLILSKMRQFLGNKELEEYQKQRQQARDSLEILMAPTEKGQSSLPTPLSISALRSKYTAFEGFLGSWMVKIATSPEESQAKAETLYDSLFAIYLQVLHTYHDGRLEQLRKKAHQLNEQTVILFWVQLGFLVTSVGVALLFTFLALLRPFQVASRQALFDNLTGLGNRRYWEKRLIPQIEDHVRQDEPFSISLMDVDRFKLFNDSHGHPAGDVLLKELTQTIRSEIRSTDEVIRFGGEEFLFVLWGTTSEQAWSILEKVREAIAVQQFLTPDGTRCSATASFGIASFPASGSSVAALVSAADKNLYLAKNQGRNQVQV